MKYLVITVEEGGADFQVCDRWQDVPIAVNPWFTEVNKREVEIMLENALIGDRIMLDGCAECVVINGTNGGEPRMSEEAKKSYAPTAAGS